VHYSEAVLAEMGVALKDDSSLVGVFSPKKVSTPQNTAQQISTSLLQNSCCSKLSVIELQKKV